MKPSISKQTLMRLPLYLNYLNSIKDKDGYGNISATSIAEAVGLHDVQVRKDLAAVCCGGRPKIGYITQEAIADIEHFLGFDQFDNNAVLVGTGNLGRAILSYGGFSKYGLNILAAFDIQESVIGSRYYKKQVLPVSKLGGICQRLKIGMGIITVPADAAQEVCDILIENGIRAIWNFAPIHLKVPDNVLVQDENMAVSLAQLSKHLSVMFSGAARN